MSNDYEFENAQSFIKAERAVEDEFSKRIKIEHSTTPEGLFVMKANFGEFAVETVRRKITGPTSSYRITNVRTGEAVDLVQLAWKGNNRFSLDVSPYPTGTYNPQSGETQVPKPVTKGALISTIHEMLHGPEFEKMNDEEKAASIQARKALKNGSASEQQRAVVISEEENDWKEVRRIIAEIEGTLGIQIIEDQSTFEGFINRRMDNYRNYGTSGNISA